MQGPMLSILAVFIILLIFGLGDMVATKTRAIVSMLFFSSVLFLAGFWTKVLPNTMFDDSTLLLVSGVLVSMLLVHMGTTIKLRDFADQWKTVLIAGIACIAISLGIYFIGGLIVADKNYVVVGAPILSGGVVATITMQTAVEGHSVELGVFAALVMVVQGFVGYPVCSLCLKSEAKRVRSLVESGQELKGVTAKIVTDAAPKKRLIPYIPDKYNGPNIMMAKVAFFAFLATITANAINGWIASTFETDFSISALIFALIYGIIAKELGFIEENPMKRAGADGFMLVVVTLSIFEPGPVHARYGRRHALAPARRRRHRQRDLPHHLHAGRQDLRRELADELRHRQHLPVRLPRHLHRHERGRERHRHQRRGEAADARPHDAQDAHRGHGLRLHHQRPHRRLHGEPARLLKYANRIKGRRFSSPLKPFY